MTTREAKEYLIAQIVAEAERQSKPLDDLERRMLYYTETAWMPEDFEQLNEDFEQSGLDRVEYENHIIGLIQHLKRSPTYDPVAWKTAIKTITREDHYLLAILDETGEAPRFMSPPYDKLKLVITACIAIGLLMLVAFIYLRFLSK